MKRNTGGGRERTPSQVERSTPSELRTGRTASRSEAIRPGSVRESSALDAEYMKAVESGDMETAQRMVTEAAERAGYDVPCLSGDSEPRYVLKTGEELDEENGVDRDYYDVGNLGNGIYLTPARMYARTFGSNTEVLPQGQCNRCSE